MPRLGRMAASCCAAIWAAVIAGCSEPTLPNAIPTVTRVSPNNGPVAGGIAVTISGLFPIGIDSVRIGNERLRELLRVTETQLAGTMPPGSASPPLDVTVYGRNGSGSCAGCFRYNPAVVWTELAVGGEHSCGLARGGAAYCWGENSVGQLGQGEGPGTTERCGVNDTYMVIECNGRPLAVTGGLTFAALSAGGYHSCGLTAVGDAHCWGLNNFGQLGDGAVDARRTPVAVVGGLQFKSLVAGTYHTCGLTAAGAAYCWGENSSGQLGDGSIISRRTPVSVASGLVFASLVAGEDRTCALTGAGQTYCWGVQGNGLRGSAPPVVYVTPEATAAGLTFTSLAGGSYHTCGLTSAGAAHCWGLNGYGQLGDGSTVDPLSPVAVSGGRVFASLTAGAYHTCGITSSGTAYCWGNNFFGGQIGIGSSTGNILAPAAVSGGLSFASLVAGAAHTCGLTNTATAYCWGGNLFREVGDGTPIDRFTPAAVLGP